MSPRPASACLLLGGLLLVGGCPGLWHRFETCATAPRPEPVRLDLAGAKASADVSDLAAVLTGAVTDDGRVQPAALRQVMPRLDNQLRILALSGPTATPGLYQTDAGRRAYWLNARLAWSLKLACSTGVSPVSFARGPTGGTPVLPDLHARTFPLDGREMSLSAIDDLLVQEARRAGDFRLAACAGGAEIDYAPLPRRPFGQEGLPDRLAEEFNRFMLDPRRFVIDIESMELRVPPMLWACRQLVIDDYQRRYGPCQANLMTALAPHLSGQARARLEGAIGYRIVPQPARWELVVPGRMIFFPGKVGRTEL